MILSYKESVIKVPISSSCVIKTKGILRDGDTIAVSSPIFSSVDSSAGSINTSETFDVKLKLQSTDAIDNTNGDTIGTLICTDNDLFNLYVRDKI